MLKSSHVANFIYKMEPKVPKINKKELRIKSMTRMSIMI